ncbi:ATP-binding protein [Thiomicrospira sp. ALE5]|uniref:ATP-binding protein n=1 Tax=Thiomicrospira sp. ALE5 TaxID=748650 RepID=UPI000B882110|nr:ATP-binding protein [Thiomicrospira sp. ALE5]
MLAILNDVLDFSKIEVNKVAIEPSAFQLKTLLKSLLEIHGPITKQKGLVFKLHVQLDTTQYIMTDELRLKQILNNLLNNAIKFTEQGEITLEVVEEHHADNQQACLCFAVTDTGIGMTREQQARLLQPFSQADNSITQRYGGTGLGLVIAEKLIKALGGNPLIIESVWQTGFCFSFKIPLKKAHKEDVAEKAAGIKRVD